MPNTTAINSHPLYAITLNITVYPIRLWKKNVTVSLIKRQNRLENIFRVEFGSVANRFADSLGAHETAAICSRANLA